MNTKIFFGKILLALGSCCLVFGSLSGCATSYGRSQDIVPVYFKANVAQATLRCGGEALELPGNLGLRRGISHDCTAQAPNHEKLNFRVWSKLSGEGFGYSTRINWQRWSKWTLGLGHLVAWPVDFISGSMKTLENDHYDLRLKPTAEASMPSKVWDKTVSATQKIVALPADAAEEVTGVVMNSVVKTPAEALGLSSEEQRKSTEQLLQGQAAAERLGQS